MQDFILYVTFEKNDIYYSKLCNELCNETLGGTLLWGGVMWSDSKQIQEYNTKVQIIYL